MYLVKFGIYIYKMHFTTVLNPAKLTKDLIVLICICAVSLNFTRAQATGSSDHFDSPLTKCWEIENNEIQSFASDNESTLVSLRNGDLIKINNADKTQIWSSSIGNQLETKPYIIKGRSISVSHTVKNSPDTGDNKNTNENKKFEIIIRETDQKTGLINWVTKITADENSGFAKDAFRLLEDPGSERIFIIQNNEITSINVQNGSIDWRTESDSNIPASSFVDNNSVYIYNARKISIYDKSNGVFIKSIKTHEDINSLQITETTIFSSDNSGKLFETDKKTLKNKRVLRTGGKITYLKGGDKNLLTISEDNFIYNYSNADDQVKWKKRLPGRVTADPFINDKMIVVSTIAEPEIYFFDLAKGTLFNRITLDSGNDIKHFQITGSKVFALTNSGLIKYQKNCSIN